jgi:hypothetical protein
LKEASNPELNLKGATMKRRNFVTACAFGLTVLAAAASGQMGMGMRPSMPSGIFSPVIGSGAQYESSTPDGAKSVIEYALVGKDTVMGKDGYWLEWTMSGAGMSQMVMKMLIVPGSNDAPSHVIMQMGKNPPMEMPMQGRMGAAPKPNLDVRTGGAGSRQGVGDDARRHLQLRALSLESRRRRMGKQPGSAVWDGEVIEQWIIHGVDQADHRRA